jgi:hypothetical protein
LAIFGILSQNFNSKLIKAEWRQIKYQGLLCRSFAQLEELFQAVDAAMVKRVNAA